MSLKHKTIRGLSWSFIDSFANQGLVFIIGVILARLLSPEEFGLIGMLAIFIAVSQIFIDSGIGGALIRKNDCTTRDYSTIFYFNMAVAVFFYLVLFVCAGTIAAFYDKPQLKPLVRVLSLNLIIGSAGMIQKTQLVKKIDFKSLAKISVISSIASGIVGIGMALAGFGVWSLVWRTIAQTVCMSGLLWLWSNWKPSWVFSAASFRELYGFGSKVMASTLIDTTYKNIYYLVIGKFFSAVELGYYTRANAFSLMPTQILTEVVQRVGYPVLSSLQDDTVRLKAGYRKLIQGTMLLSFVLMIGLAAAARPFVLSLIGEKWEPSIAYLQLLCFAAMLYPLHSLNMNMLAVKGLSGRILKLEILNKILIVPALIPGIFLGVRVLIAGLIVHSVVTYLINSHWSGKVVNYSTWEQLLDIAPPFAIALMMSMGIYVLGLVLPFHPAAVLAAQTMLGAFIFFGLMKIIPIDSYAEMVHLIRAKLTREPVRPVSGTAFATNTGEQ